LTTTATSELPAGYWVEPSTGAWCSIPWPSDPDERSALAAASLGPAVIDWAEGRTVEPGLTDYLTGLPWRFTPGQKRYLVLWYLVGPSGRFVYRSGVKRGAKGTGKDPFGAAWCLIELLGPSQFTGFDDAGLPVGARHLLPLVQIASNSEQQSKDVLRVANAMLGRDAREYYGIDAGETRTIITSGGRLEILTASEKSSEGDPATAIMLNESHHMTESSGGHRVAEVARRNVGKSPAALQARLCEFTNAHREGSDSVAERSYLAWQAQVSGQAKRRDILYDSREAAPSLDLDDDDARMAALRAAYADAPWVDLERLSDEVLDPRTSLADSIRYYLNGLAAAEDAWIEPRRFDELADATQVVVDREPVSLFLDCSKSTDATGLVGCRLSDGFVFTIHGWQRPHGRRGDGWLAPREEVDAQVRAVFDRFRVVWFGVDPSPARDDEDESLYWMPLVDRWHQDFGRKLPVWATPGAKGHAVKFDMRLSQPGGHERNRLFTESAMQTARDIDEDRALTHDGHPMLRLHTHNARRRPNQWGVSLGKATRDSSRLVDLAVCMVGARLGRRLVLNSKWRPSNSGKGRVIVL
jgi:hypothetical protein